ncbi:hypothetical protein C4D60_Mb04t39300 [Musa balbisiana]|uniref:40S ribosomal protein S19 n=1 Tax=Musa balbisiana TaxID=52838 RepID=A0A4S8KI26_MUSBA|nr:hypothetical protein C4D60_Mb04t39300 [Musa balbisiana]
MVSIPRGRSKPQQKRLRTENPTPAVAKTVKDVSPDEFASMARKIILEARNWIGVGGFQKIYGGRKRNGSRPPHFCKSSGAIACRILQQLQRINIIEIDPKGTITSQGQRDLDQVAGRV